MLAAKFPFFSLECVCQVSFTYETSSNHWNWHREDLRSDREKTGETQGIWEKNLSGDPDSGTINSWYQNNSSSCLIHRL